MQEDRNPKDKEEKELDDNLSEELDQLEVEVDQLLSNKYFYKIFTKDEMKVALDLEIIKITIQIINLIVIF